MSKAREKYINTMFAMQTGGKVTNAFELLATGGAAALAKALARAQSGGLKSAMKAFTRPNYSTLVQALQANLQTMRDKLTALDAQTEERAQKDAAKIRQIQKQIDYLSYDPNFPGMNVPRQRTAINRTPSNGYETGAAGMVNLRIPMKNLADGSMGSLLDRLDALEQQGRLSFVAVKSILKHDRYPDVDGSARLLVMAKAKRDLSYDRRFPGLKVQVNRLDIGGKAMSKSDIDRFFDLLMNSEEVMSVQRLRGLLDSFGFDLSEQIVQTLVQASR